MKKRIINLLINSSGILVAFALILGLFNLKLNYETRYIPSAAMEPTLQANDRIIVYKNSYKNQSPNRGDLIIFNPTQSLKKAGFKSSFVKRIIGLPGETIEVKNKQVYINNQPLIEDYILEKPEYTFPPTKIPNNSYFVLGDSRNNSYDSHIWGFVESNLIIGRVTRIYFPFSRAQKF